MARLTETEVSCPWCGPVRVQAAELRCDADSRGGGALCEFFCPNCRRIIYLRIDTDGLQAIRLAGAQRFQGACPLELLESHRGQPLQWQDLLEFQAGLATTSCLSEVVVRCDTPIAFEGLEP
ncbi:MAG: hypothetical protein QOH66_2493 [Actinomycetota bacterium]|jgi:hypothetical protein|nr:hypothetical protein [Actinomycetota bacterium]